MKFYVSAEGAGKVKRQWIMASTPQAALSKFKKFNPEFVIKYSVSDDPAQDYLSYREEGNVSSS
jgi:hypothetical protein